MMRITWHLNGTTRLTVVGHGMHVQDAFGRLSRRDRRDITMFATRCEVSPD